jgi:hypothetical protein
MQHENTPLWHSGEMPIKKKDAASKWDNSVERKIHFFRAHVGVTDAGKPKPFKVAPVLKYLNGLRYRDGERYTDVGEGNVLGAWVDSGSTPYRMRLATVRRTSLPMVEEGGNLSGLSLTTTQGLYEPIHICFFPNNIVGIEFNFYGPRPSRLSSYLAVAASGVCPEVGFEPLLRQDVTEQLDRLDRLKVFDLAVRTSWIGTIRRANQNLGAAFQAAANVGQSQIVHIMLEPDAYQRRAWLNQRMAGIARRVASAAGLRENAAKFVVRGRNQETDAIDEVDVLRDQLISSKRIFRMDQRSRVLDDASAYTAIEEAHAELRSDLEAAASARLI